MLNDLRNNSIAQEDLNIEADEITIEEDSYESDIALSIIDNISISPEILNSGSLTPLSENFAYTNDNLSAVLFEVFGEDDERPKPLKKPRNTCAKSRKNLGKKKARRLENG